MGEAAEVLNTAFKKSCIVILAIPSLRLNLEYITQYKYVSEKKFKKILLKHREKK